MDLLEIIKEAEIIRILHVTRFEKI